MKDEHQPGEKWEFNEEVATVFDDMLARSIPQYDVMRKACFDIGSRYVKEHTDIVDLGCSRGEALRPFIEKFGAYNRYLGVEVSKPMRDAATQSLQNWINTKLLRIINLDLRHSYPLVQSSLTLCVLTLQFTPIEYRQNIVRSIYNGLIAGGALVLVEKVLGDGAEIDKVLVDIYHKFKLDNGYDHESIDRKRLSLEGVLVPVTAAWNRDLLYRAGFNQIDCFWRWMNFVGWVAVK